MNPDLGLGITAELGKGPIPGKTKPQAMTHRFQ